MKTLEQLVKDATPAELVGGARFLEFLSLKESDNLDNPAGFKLFYELLYDRPVPPMAYKEWVIPMYQASEDERGIVIQAFRGSTKTTTVTLAFTAFQIGLHPMDSHLLIMDTDKSALLRGREISRILDENPAYELLFPEIEKDKEAGWSENGFNVYDSRMAHTEFMREKSKITPDPTLFVSGVTGSIIGKHPTNMLIFDDIHNEKNTRSDRTLMEIRETVTGSILPTTQIPGKVIPFKIFIGTPWTHNDTMMYLLSTGLYDEAKTPILRKDKDDDEVPTWVEGYPMERIEERRIEWGELQFARMGLLDLEAASGIHLKREWLHEFPEEDVQESWETVFGVDYASTADMWESKGKERDYFTIAVGKVIPGGAGVVLTGGFRGRVSQGEAEKELVSMAGFEPRLREIGVERDGKGEEFVHLLIRTTPLPINTECYTRGKSKGWRFETQMAPIFQYGRAKISTADNPFLKHFREEWIRFPQGAYDDTLDAVFWMLFVARGDLMEFHKPEDLSPINPMYPKETVTNPFNSWGKH